MKKQSDIKSKAREQWEKGKGWNKGRKQQPAPYD